MEEFNFSEYEGYRRNIEKEMLKIDLSRGGTMALDYDEFVEVFGEPNDEDLFDLTQSYIKLYMKMGDDDSIPFVVDMYGEKWLNVFLKYNERIEEYELCAILKSHIEIYKKELENV